LLAVGAFGVNSKPVKITRNAAVGQSAYGYFGYESTVGNIKHDVQKGKSTKSFVYNMFMYGC